MNRMKIFYFLFFTFLGILKAEGQQSKFSINQSVLNEVKITVRAFEDSISHYDYSKNKVLFSEKYREFYGNKLQKLKELYQKKYDNDKLITQNKEVKTPAFSESDIENFSQLKDLNEYLKRNFPTYFFNDSSSGKYSCQLIFKIDVDGEFKKITYKGENTEFNLISALYLYAVEKLEKPLIYQGKPVAFHFSQPFSMYLE